MDLHLTPIRPRRISDQVVDQLKEHILCGELKPGEKIMPEREMAETLGVSRTSVRDALRKLVVMGLLDRRQGQGTFVCDPETAGDSLLDMALRTEDATVGDLLEVRMGLECHAAALAAKRADKKDIQFLEKSLRIMEAEVRAGELGKEADMAFHMAISYATKNPLQAHLIRNLFSYLFVGIRTNLTHLYKNPDSIRTILKQHTEIAEAIRNRKPESAYKLMMTHILYATSHPVEIYEEPLKIS